jgi:hypothetical protein
MKTGRNSEGESKRKIEGESKSDRGRHIEDREKERVK